MRLDVCRIDGCTIKDGVVPGQGFKHLQPQPLTAPAVEPVIDGCVGAELRRAIAPARAALEHIHDARDNAAVINPMRALRPRGKSGSIRAQSSAVSH